MGHRNAARNPQFLEGGVEWAGGRRGSCINFVAHKRIRRHSLRYGVST
jgi:hypothetical protein